MTTTAEFSLLLDQFTATYEQLTALTEARNQEPGTPPVLIDPSDEEIVLAHLKYEDAWQAVSQAAGTLWQKAPGNAKNRNIKRDYADQVADEHDPYDIDSPIFHGPE